MVGGGEREEAYLVVEIMLVCGVVVESSVEGPVIVFFAVEDSFCRPRPVITPGSSLVIKSRGSLFVLLLRSLLLAPLSLQGHELLTIFALLHLGKTHTHTHTHIQEENRETDTEIEVFCLVLLFSPSKIMGFYDEFLATPERTYQSLIITRFPCLLHHLSFQHFVRRT